MKQRRALRIRVSGAVQGVGFRPFVYRLATSLSLAGEVRNTAQGVDILLEGSSGALDAFVCRLTAEAPPLALLDRVVRWDVPSAGRTDFRIAASASYDRVETLVSADFATCLDCLRELTDPTDRRYRYPFINCTNCGPRFTIIQSMPYDRRATTMAGFAMCPECLREYHDSSDRRFHAQPNACPVCGPRVRFLHASDTPVMTPEVADALSAAAALLQAGGILAVKGLGGYHLACDATDEGAVARLRHRKSRDEKPLAVMVDSIETARSYCHVSREEAVLLTSPSRPIVLLERSGHAHLARGVARGMSTYGVFLPYTPLHHLLLLDCARPLVMTSGNLSDEPIAYRDDDALARLTPLADAFLTHNRPIHVRTDDSVVRVLRGGAYPLRRARGYAPLPVHFSGSKYQILAMGGHLKNTFCLTRGEQAFLSHHMGDLESLDTLRSLQRGVKHFRRLLGLSPTLVVHDLHPDYLSTRYALEYARTHDLPTLAVQHHEAHVASVLADSGHSGPVVGVAFDGAGYGADGTVWGGEFFVGRSGALRRAAHLEHLALPGGDRAAREPWRMALALLELHRRSEGLPPEALVPLLEGTRTSLGIEELPWATVLQMIRRRVNAPFTSSAGRLFDSVSALLGFVRWVSYEGQAAVALEAAARWAAAAGGLPSKLGPGPWPVPEGSIKTQGRSSDGPRVVSLGPIAAGVLRDLSAGLSREDIALRFHLALAATTAGVVSDLAAEERLDTVALTGGVFQNTLLLDLLAGQLEADGMRVLVHRTVPPNDGGLCLGQAEIAACLLAHD